MTLSYLPWRQICCGFLLSPPKSINSTNFLQQPPPLLLCCLYSTTPYNSPPLLKLIHTYNTVNMREIVSHHHSFNIIQKLSRRDIFFCLTPEQNTPPPLRERSNEADHECLLSIGSPSNRTMRKYRFYCRCLQELIML